MQCIFLFRRHRTSIGLKFLRFCYSKWHRGANKHVVQSCRFYFSEPILSKRFDCGAPSFLQGHDKVSSDEPSASDRATNTGVIAYCT